MTKLYDLPSRQTPGPKIYTGVNGDPDGWIEFDHIDGMYSYNRAYLGDGTYVGVAHLAAWTSLEPHGDGWAIADDEDEEE